MLVIHTGGNPDVDPTPYGCANLSEDGQGSFDDAGFDITFVIADGKPNYQCYPNPAIEIDGMWAPSMIFQWMMRS